MFTCIVALVFVSTLSPTSSRGTTPIVEATRLRRRHRGQTVFEPRRFCYGDASSAVRGDKEKALVEYTARATLPRGVSGNWDRQANSRCSRRKLMLLYEYSTSRLLTLRLLMSYIYGAPSKARNANVVYIWTYVRQR